MNIACGMDTRVYCLKTLPSVRWYNLDLPETIEVHRRFLMGVYLHDRKIGNGWAAEIEEWSGRTLIIRELRKE